MNVISILCYTVQLQCHNVRPKLYVKIMRCGHSWSFASWVSQKREINTCRLPFIVPSLRTKFIDRTRFKPKSTMMTMTYASDPRVRSTGWLSAQYAKGLHAKLCPHDGKTHAVLLSCVLPRFKATMCDACYGRFNSPTVLH